VASKRRVRRQACGDKARYPDETVATAALISFKRRVPDRGWMHAYHCRWCGQWHIGHPPGRVRQSIRDKRGVA
jgi:hypothetical protein